MQRTPVAEAPSAAPVKPSSEIGVSTMRSGAELLVQVLRMGEGAAALTRSFAEIDDIGVAAHLLGDAVAHGVEPARLAPTRHVAAPARRPRPD